MIGLFIFTLINAVGAANIINYNLQGCGSAGNACLSISEAHCCRAGRAVGGSVKTTRVNGEVGEISIPYTGADDDDGTEIHCQHQLQDYITLGDLPCLSRVDVGSAIWLSCARTYPAGSVDEEDCRSYKKRDLINNTLSNEQLQALAGFKPDGCVEPDMFFDAAGNEITEEQYHEYTDIELATGMPYYPDEANTTTLSKRARSVTAYGSARCRGQVTSTGSANGCHSAGDSLSMEVTSLPSGCVVDTFSSGDCSGTAEPIYVKGSSPGCYQGANFDSYKIVCK